MSLDHRTEEDFHQVAGHSAFPVQDEDFDGVEDEPITGEATIVEPFDPTLIRVSIRTLTLDLLLARIQHEEMDLAPGFQRSSGIWTDSAQSRLIESILIRIPLPSFYMDATDEDKWLVIDGLQRLTAMKRFVLDENFALSGLEFLRHLETKRFDELPRSLQRRILESQVTVHLIERGTPPEVKFNIFKRINTGGLPLSTQEIRHALNQGKATEMLSRLANSEEFRRATGNSISGRRMADRECVLRFLAFTLVPYSEYRTGDLDAFLNGRMAEINKMDEAQIASLDGQFLRSMKLAAAVFGRFAFRKIVNQPNHRLPPINRALFESWSVTLNRLDEISAEVLVARREMVLEEFNSLLGNADFVNAISQGTGAVNKVRRRFESIEKIVARVLL